MSEILLAAALSKYDNIYGLKFDPYIEKYSSLTSLYNNVISSKSLDSIDITLKTRLRKIWSKVNLTNLKADLSRDNIKCYLRTDPDYPTLLAQTPDSPYVIYVKGDISCLKCSYIVSCVGTRAITSYGKRVVANLIGGLANIPVCVISGLALGIDGEVHKISLEKNIATVAVLGGGLDRYEPVSNANIANLIAKQHCLISEYPPGVRPQKHHFLERNRIIAGLSQGTIVIEGKYRSGSLVTARLALGYGREVGAVPGDIFAPNSEGPLQLISEGAWPIRTSNDIRAMLGCVEEDQKIQSDSRRIYTILNSTPCNIDQLQHVLGMSLADIQAELTDLELEGKLGVNAVGEYYLKV